MSLMHQFIFGREACFAQKGPFCKNNFYEMPYQRSIDIDTLSDFKLVEFLKMKINFKELFNLNGYEVFSRWLWFNWISNC